MNHYKRLAKDYDYLNPKEEIFKQRSFFKKLIKEYSVNICLDCACGTGWHLFMLDHLGVECYGSDLSPEMLALAKKNLRRKNIPLKIGDFRKLSKTWEEQFEMVICMTTSLPHMLTDKDAMTALNSMYEQLSDRGILVISNGITDSLLRSKPKLIPARILKHRAFYFFLEYPNSERVIFNILQVKKTKKSSGHTYPVIYYNAMRKFVLKKYFAGTKFKKVQYFGDYKFTPYSVKKSGRLIVIAQK
jgi:ubiquinone/menaquinone biosynthesis C-methylase UbiE